MTKICEQCGKHFAAWRPTNRWCSRQCKWESTYPASGTRFQFLTAVGFSHRGTGGRAYFTFDCDCGTRKALQLAGVKNGRVKSCGCWHSVTSTINGKNARTHGMSFTPEWNSYHAAKKRCRNPRCGDYKNYGGRGIEFRFESFDAFFATVGAKPSPLHSIDRIDVNGHYEPGNVRWATDHEQRMNKRPRHANVGI